MSKRGEVLVTIINNKADFAILREKFWYRIPVSSVKKWLIEKWPPKWLAFYQTNALDAEKHAIVYFAKVESIHRVLRGSLFPNQPQDARNNKYYYQIFIKPLEKLPKPIYSRRFRRIIFIPTTLKKFVNAVEINDLYDESSLEDKLWAELKRHNIPAERQEYVVAKGNDYALDFAVYCAKGKLDLETDGDFWHANPEKAVQDNVRDHNLNREGWQVLRFTTKQIQEQAADYCISTVADTINKLGGLEDGKAVPRKINLDGDSYQPSLFDDLYTKTNFQPKDSEKSQLTDINNQTEYWNRVAREKEFTHPINVALLQTYLPLNSRILDYGCGYGRVCHLLADAGYGDVLGVDSSSAMIQRGRELYPELALDVLPASGMPYPQHSFDAVILFSVLTCIPTDSGQQTLLKNLKRMLRPGGFIYISDLVLQDDERNQERYQQNQKEFGVYGTFRLPEGTIVRHLSTKWIDVLTSDFEMMKIIDIEVVTMNGHKAKAFQYFGRLG